MNRENLLHRSQSQQQNGNWRQQQNGNWRQQNGNWRQPQDGGNWRQQGAPQQGAQGAAQSWEERGPPDPRIEAELFVKIIFLFL